ncbi:DUF2567 domain-containing protein [Nocardia sp. CDC153]|uniref:DUF2567 domain-containing protein n=1 Tax=Nocardia sp. CDC153 TaxID=3112167 RepID=UPI002DB92B70|nr:DUF2567 domain-containing protein [Nocardia sp. CDC153]MEC3958529.1 DUF2567 domain-containing protein [Nocardia sp. CDC153]
MATTLTAEPGGLRVDVVMREVRAAAVVFAALAAVSALAGVVWAYLAPAEQLLVVEPDRGTALTGESMHRFDALAIFVLIGIVLGVVGTAAVWRWRRVRGPILLCGILLGSLAGAFLTKVVGEAVAEQLHTRPKHPAVHTIVEFAPSVEGWAALIAQPLAAAVVVLLLTALSTSDDLGTGEYLPFGGQRPEPTIIAPPQYGSAISYGPYPGSPAGNQFTPRDPVVPFEAPGAVPESDTAR